MLTEELKAKTTSFGAAVAEHAIDSFGTAAVKAGLDGTYYFTSRNC